MPAIQQLRCARHQNREAAAKCVLCGKFFCRECVTEHDGRMLCAPCLRSESLPSSAKKKAWSRFPLRLFLAFCSVSLLWIVFYGAGKLLLTVPNRFHEGIMSPAEKIDP